MVGARFGSSMIIKIIESTKTTSMEDDVQEY